MRSAQNEESRMTQFKIRQWLPAGTWGASGLLLLLLNACQTVTQSPALPEQNTPRPRHTAPLEKTTEAPEGLPSARNTRLGLLEQLERLDGKWLGAQQEHNSIWPRVQRGYALTYNPGHPEVQKFVRQYVRYPGHIQQVVLRATPYLHYILSEVEKRGMPAEIALLPMVESAFDPFAHSHMGAAGIWQLMPAAGKRFGLKQDWWYDGRRDIVASTQAALDYLQKLHDLFDNDWLLALAAYNSGEGTVQRAILKNKRAGQSTHFFNLNLPQQTRHYVPKLLALSTIFRQPHQYQLDLPAIENRPYLQTVRVDSQIDLAFAAELADMDLKLLYRLNPGFNRWATHPNGPQDLLLPADNAKRFKASLSKADEKEWVQWKRYSIQQGDTLRSIATLYRTTVDVLKYVNNLSSNQLTVGQTLLIPNQTKAARTSAPKSLMLGHTSS